MENKRCSKLGYIKRVLVRYGSKYIIKDGEVT
jgi:hypothetical protein